MTPRDLIEGDPAGWLAWVGLPIDGPVQAIDSEVSTVLAEVDKVLLVDAQPPWLAHFELQSTRDPELPFRLLQYHALLLRRHQRTVESTVVLLRPSADGPEMSGLFERHSATGALTVSFHFRVVRLWERPVEELLGGSLGILPLAPLADVAPADLPGVFHRVNERLTLEATPDSADLLWAAMTLLLDLRYDRVSLREILREMRRFRDSVVYQVIEEEVRATVEEEVRASVEEEVRASVEEEVRLDEARRLVVLLGSDRLGPPDAATRETIENIDDLDTLERLIRRVPTAPAWHGLLAEATGS